MSTPEQPFPQPTPVNPQSELLFLLGGMNAKLDGVITEQSAQRGEAAEFRTEVRTEVGALRTDLGAAVGRIDVIESKERPRMSFPVVIGGIGGTVAATTGLIFLIQWLASTATL